MPSAMPVDPETTSSSDPSNAAPVVPPSPEPAPPTARAPGPRATALQKVFNDALSHTLRACSYANFAECFPTPAKYVPQALDGLHRDFVGKLEEMCKGEFQALMEERDVITSLNELDDLIADARRRKQRALESSAESGQQEGAQVSTPAYPIPPHLLPPPSLLTAHLNPFLGAQSAALTNSLADVQKSNQSIAEDIAAQHREIEQLLRGLETAAGDVENAAAAFAGEEMQGVELELERAAGVVVG